LLAFGARNLLFGFENANKMLERVSEPCVIPILKRYGATIGDKCDLGTGLVFHNCKNYKNLIIGNNCHIGKNCFFDLRGKIEIKSNVVISMKNIFITHIDMNKSELSKKFPSKIKNIIIRENVYIGSDCCILKGVEIGRNSIVAAKSLVNKNIYRYSIYGGVPIKKIKSIG
jgi:acetyltransferase-like isoleucine patch superfamily enzyme